MREDGLYSFKAVGGKHTMLILRKEVRELWTHFDFIKGLLVVRLIYGGTKTEFGVPLEASLGWLRAMGKLVLS